MRIIGIMSGTSIDGIDVAECEIQGQPPHLEARILQAATVPYQAPLRDRILAVCEAGTTAEVCRLNFEIGTAIADAILSVVKDIDLIDLIGSHGQTVWHDVDNVGQVTSTLQIGTASILAEKTGVTTLDNFRARDISAGGHGAPLTAYVDWLLLRHATQWRAIQNIGGMGNVSFLPPLDNEQEELIAFDTGPGNALIDAAINLLSDGTKQYDENGQLAGCGTVSKIHLSALLEMPFFKQAPPRTTGRELFGNEMAHQLVQMWQTDGLYAEDILATLTAFTVESIAHSYRAFAPEPISEVILGGGGVHNKTLRYMLAEALHPANILDHQAIGLDNDFKEALVFAVLAYETWHNRIGTLPTQTGARHSTVLGQITPGANYTSLIRRTWL